VSRTFQRDIDGIIDQLARDLAVPCHMLAPETREAWVDTVLRESGLPLHPPQIDLFSAKNAGAA